MQSSVLIRFYFGIWLISIAAEAVFVFHLVRSGLGRPYRSILVWAVIDVCASLVALGFTEDARGYLAIYIGSQVAIAICQVIAVSALFSAHLEDYPGIGSFGSKMLAVLVGVAVVFSLLVIHFDWIDARSAHEQAVAFSRVLASGLAIFLASMKMFFWRYRVPTRPNLDALENSLGLNFAVQTIAVVAILTLGSQAEFPAAFASILANLTTFLYWIIALKKSGERVPAGVTYDPEDHAKVERLNEEALKLAGSIRDGLWRR